MHLRLIKEGRGMGKVLYFDCFSGISGDMTLGALMDLGINPSDVSKELAKLNLEGFSLEAEKKQKYGILGTEANVIITKHKDQRHRKGEDNHSHHHYHGRNFREIREIINKSSINERAKDLAIRIFSTIAEGEGKVHGKSVDEVHFHEVGAIDSIIDIVGTAICMDILDIDKVYCSVLTEGSGFIECEHGTLPVPVPAVVEMLKGSDISIRQGDVKTELITPTGLGILKGLGAVSVPLPEMKIISSGLGFGKRDTGKLNGLRVIMGSVYNEEWSSLKPEEEIYIIESNIDDESGEIIGYTTELLMNSGALDVYCVPIQMKKGRPGVILSVICKKEDVDLLSGIILMETASLGVRITFAERIAFQRQIHNVETPYGNVGIKVSRLGSFSKAKPEYEDCARIARSEGISISEVYALAMEIWINTYDEDK